MTLALTDIIAKRDDQMEADIGAETLMMRVESGRYYSVDGPAQAIWTAIDGKTPVAGVVEALLERYDADRATCEAETIAFMNELLDQKLITRIEKETR